jgi:hypothetical protein
MGLKTTFLAQDQLHSQLLETIEDIESIYSKINLILHEDLYPLKKESYHFIGKVLTRLGKDTRVTQAFTSMLFRSAYRGEVTSAGSAHIAFLFGLHFAKQIIRSNLINTNEAKLKGDLEDTIEYFKNHLRASTEFPGPDNLQGVVKACCSDDEVLAHAVWEALQLAGVEGKIFVENGRQSNYVVELKEGYNFNLRPFDFMLKNKTWEMRDCKMLVVDGLVEKISEIDQLLNNCLNTKQPMVIFAHGFSEEVAATLKINQEKGLLDVQPVRIPSDVDSLNVANDIAVVCGTSPVSAMKGDMVVFVKYDELPTVDRVRLSKHQCSIENSKTRLAVSEQIRALLEKRQSYLLHEEVQELFDKRMRSLVSNTVNVHLPNMPANKLDAQRVKIDVALRQAKAMLNHGIVDFNKIGKKFLLSQTQTCSDLDRCFRAALTETIQQYHETFTPTLSALLGCALSSKDVLMFLTASGVVKIED